MYGMRKILFKGKIRFFFYKIEGTKKVRILYVDIHIHIYVYL